MEWQTYANPIREVLGLKGSPIAVTYAMEAPTKHAGGKHRVCDAFLKVAKGKTIDLTKETSSCPGGTWHLGLGERPKGERDKALKEFLVKGEKLYCSIAAFNRAQGLAAQPPLGLADHVVLSPLEEAEFPPDIVVFLCNAEQACRLVTLDSFSTGIPPRIEMSGATCHQVIAYPVVTGELNVSLMDYTSRHIRGYQAEDLFVSIPYHRFLGVMRSLDACTAGRAKMEIPESFRRLMGSEAIEGLEGSNSV